MEENRTRYARAYSRRECRSWRFEQYMINDRPLEHVMFAPHQTQLVSGSQKSVDQWKWWFKREGIYKNLNKEEAVYLKRELNRIASQSGQTEEEFNCWVIAGNELLLQNKHIDKSYARVKNPEHVVKEPTRRPLITIHLPSNLNSLRQPEVFRNFQRLIFNTRVHFDASFEANIWAPDERGVHARNPELRRELEILSDMHNQFTEACRQFQSENTRRGWALVRSTFDLSERIVRIQHHRLFPDILGILLLLQKGDHPEAPGLDKILREHLWLLARAHLSENDPRRQFFELIMLAPLESIHHLYLTFDRQCRQLWSSKVKDNEIESYYSYNQASFPRADRGGFYSLFEGKTIAEICDILSHGDSQFGFYSTEAICLWHTALQFFSSTERYADMVFVSQKLCVRLEKFKDRWDRNLPEQLNHDAAMSFYLYGHAEHARGITMRAMDAFFQCVKLRSQVLNWGEFDPLKGLALRQLESIMSRVGDGTSVGFYQGLLDTMYSDLETKDMQDTTSFQYGTHI